MLSSCIPSDHLKIKKAEKKGFFLGRVILTVIHVSTIF